MTSAQKSSDILRNLLILRFLHFLLTRRQALAHVIVKTDFLWHYATFTERIHTIEELFRLLCSITIRIRAEIFCFIFNHPTCDFKPRVSFIRYFDIRKCLIVLQKYVITRHMLLNQIALKNERFHVTGRNNIFEICNISDKPLSFTIMTACKIRANPVLKHLRLTHINNGAFFILHQIAPGQVG
ncbi:hypothetical protein D3C78_775600 [compost metagenome]